MSFNFGTLSRSQVPSPVVLPSSTTGVSNPRHYEAIRTAVLMLCKEILQHQTGLKKRDLEVVRIRMRALRRLEIVWGPDGSEAYMNGIGLGASIIEEKTPRLFARALQDGYILCQ